MSPVEDFFHTYAEVDLMRQEAGDRIDCGVQHHSICRGTWCPCFMEGHGVAASRHLDVVDLQERMQRAHKNLLDLADKSGSRSTSRRLCAKADGVGLALSYVNEALAEVTRHVGRTSVDQEEQ